MTTGFISQCSFNLFARTSASVLPKITDTHELHILHAPLLFSFFGYASRCHPRKMRNNFEAAVNRVIVFIIIITSLRE